MFLFKNRVEWLDSLPKDLVFAEVGVFYGDFAAKIYERCKLKKLFLIDCWEFQGGEYQRDPLNNCFSGNNNSVFEHVCNNFAGKKEIEIIRAFSTDACKYFEKEFFDVVYIDADHGYNAVLRDLNDWWPLVKPGGFLAGHDYLIHPDTPWIEVVQAVNTFMNENSLSFHSLSTELDLPHHVPSWSIRKTN